MQAVTTLRRLGYSLEADGETIRFRYTGAGKPPAEARPLIEELRCRKAEALAALQGWNQAEACRLLVSVQERLAALLGDAPVPELDLVAGAAYQRLAAAQDARNWPAFIEALEGFERAWRERIARH